MTHTEGAVHESGTFREATLQEVILNGMLVLLSRRGRGTAQDAITHLVG